jgi:hypothetical protein
LPSFLAASTFACCAGAFAGVNPATKQIVKITVHLLIIEPMKPPYQSDEAGNNYISKRTKSRKTVVYYS